MIAVALLGKILRLQFKTLLTVLAATVDVYFGTLIALLIRYYKELHLRTIQRLNHSATTLLQLGILNG